MSSQRHLLYRADFLINSHKKSVRSSYKPHIIQSYPLSPYILLVFVNAFVLMYNCDFLI